MRGVGDYAPHDQRFGLAHEVARAGGTMTIREPQIAHVRVHEAMHTGILTTDPTTPLRTVARLMADQHVHAVAVADPDHSRRPWGIITALDIASAAAEDLDITAGEAAASEVLTVSSMDPLDYAAHLMVEHGLTHLIVVDAATGHASGILSTLDVVAVYAARE
jgi:CBS domain-containing protein